MNLTDINPFVRYVRSFDMFVERLKMVPRRTPVDCRLIYCIEGEGKNSINGKIITLKPGDILIINAGVSYKAFKSAGKSIVINFDYTQNFSHLKYILPLDEGVFTEQVKFEDYPGLNEYIHCKNIHSVKGIVQRILKEYENKLQEYESINSSLIKSVIITAVRESDVAQRINTNLNVEQLVSYIQKNYTGNINNNILSDKFHFHPNYINNVFKKIMGKTIHQYIIELRIEKAVSLLEESDLSIADIARETGFYDSSYFSKYFKKIMGVSPKKYR